MKCPKCGKIWSDFNSIASNTYICPYCGDNFALDGEVREDISQILKKLVEDFGKDVLLDVSRTNALLMDYAPHSKKERKLIVMVMKEGILSQLLCLANKTDDEKKFGINKCIKQLMSDILITEDAARYAITVLANAVGVVSSVTQSRPMILTRHPNTSTEPESPNLGVHTESPEIAKLRRLRADIMKILSYLIKYLFNVIKILFRILKPLFAVRPQYLIGAMISATILIWAIVSLWINDGFLQWLWKPVVGFFAFGFAVNLFDCWRNGP